MSNRNLSVAGGDCRHSGLARNHLPIGFPTRSACGNDGFRVIVPVSEELCPIHILLLTPLLFYTHQEISYDTLMEKGNREERAVEQQCRSAKTGSAEVFLVVIVWISLTPSFPQFLSGNPAFVPVKPGNQKKNTGFPIKNFGNDELKPLHISI